MNSTGSLPTTSTYKPFDKPTTSGQSSLHPYLFAEMEYDFNTGFYDTRLLAPEDR